MRIGAKALVLSGAVVFGLSAVAFSTEMRQGRDVSTQDNASAKTGVVSKARLAVQSADLAARSSGSSARAVPAPTVSPAKHSAAATLPAVDEKALPAHIGLDFTHFRVGNRNVKAMFPDGDLMWVGTSGGVIRYDTVLDDYRLFDVRGGLLSNGVFHLSKLGDRLVVGTYGGGLSLLDLESETWSNLNIQHGLGDAFIYDVLETPSGDVWIATWSGVNRVRGGRFQDRDAWELHTVASTNGGLPNDWVYGLAMGADGEIWMATEGGLARFGSGQWRHWGHAEGLGAPFEQVRDQISFTRDPAKESNHHARQKQEQGLGDVDVAYNPNYIVALLVDAQGIVWCGTWGGGLARFDGTRWRNYIMSDGLPANHVFMLELDPAGGMWVGTSKGLAHFDGERFVTFTTSDGLFADNVFSLAADSKGTVWVGSYGGVARISGLKRSARND